MQLSDFDFPLPEALIAQHPLDDRSASRLLRLDRATGRICHRQFSALPQLMSRGDLLVRNETRVLPARLLGRKASGGHLELLLVRQTDAADHVWRCLTRSSKPLRVGNRLDFGEGLAGEVVAEEGDGQRLVRFSCQEPFHEVLERLGHMPLPPYIRRADHALDRDRYQTIFARNPGAVAAPTAGLHFTAETFAALAARGVEVCGITLHVGPGTFLPVRVDNLCDHRMHTEQYDIPPATAARINAARAAGRRIIALGTTVTRTLEHAVDHKGLLRSGCGETDLFIKPGFRFRMVDALITNFHLPKSTLLVLAAAFAGRDLILAAYREAIEQGYRFFSYGDCMLIE